MSKENPAEQQQHGGWQPTPQGDYDGDATAFVQLPPEDLADIPLAAPGHGYTPPMILPLTPAAGLDPAATGNWTVQTPDQQPAPDPVHWPDPNQQSGYGHPHPGSYQEPYGTDPAATAQWPVDTSSWPDPAAALSDDSGELYTPPPAADWYADRPATLPGGAPAPWAVPDAAGAAEPSPGDLAGASGEARADGSAGVSASWAVPGAGGAGEPSAGDLAGASGEARGDGSAGVSASWSVPDAAGAAEPSAGGPADASGDVRGDGSAGVPASWAVSGAGGAAEPVAGDLAGAAGAARGDGSAGVSASWAVSDAGGAAEPVAGDLAGAPGGVRADGPTGAPAAGDADGLTGAPAAGDPDASAAAPAAGDADGLTGAPSAGDADASDAAPAESAPEAAEPVGGERPEPAADALADAPGAVPDPVAQAPAGEAPPDATAPEAADTLQPAEVPEAPAPEGPPPPSEHPAASYTLHVNGVDRPVTDAWIGESLLYVLRERLGLAGAKDGCSQGECGACNVQVDGRLVASCLVPAATTAGSEVRTVEGLAVDGEPSDVQRALADCGAVQCGFCIPGMAMTVHDLLEGNHRPSELETRRALCGNLCRCSGYRGVLNAVNEVIAARAAAAEAAEAAGETGTGEPEKPRVPHQAAPGAGSVQAHQQDGDMA
ncbi:2Fe-2S iron-sulfur cluster binding domain-containing protein [Streptomyces sp. 130]|uniref:2Fe-2S iron-sulfur cluster-binding protein n=1 Tax=Streptomyces sp. 130 TaxID=2591006 RepID=UPI00117DB0EB|nr:(2Fe-2S)-binding protein [Streptomyces sp. 130]TRV81551.1 2Fe-2S iron-sulfur cluster binding domain-containing protein [Streptomyces sp. 130]